jgi:hypothetical protein
MSCCSLIIVLKVYQNIPSDANDNRLDLVRCDVSRAGTESRIKCPSDGRVPLSELVCLGHYRSQQPRTADLDSPNDGLRNSRTVTSSRIGSFYGCSLPCKIFANQFMRIPACSMMLALRRASSFRNVANSSDVVPSGSAHNFMNCWRTRSSFITVAMSR